MKIICYRKIDDIDIVFLDEYEYIVRNTTYCNFKSGQIKNPYDKSLYGVGYMGVGKFSSRNSEMKKPSDEYEVWTGMMGRCYHDKEKYPAYCGVTTVCEQWHCFQNFAKWFDDNKYEVDGRLHIDKDILYPNCKIYSPETCLLIPQRINMLFLNKPNKRGLPNGISKSKSGKFAAVYCGKHIGTYSTLESAYAAYAEEKEKKIKQVADEYRNIIPKKAYEALYAYKLDIKNDKNYGGD